MRHGRHADTSAAATVDTDDGIDAALSNTLDLDVSAASDTLDTAVGTDVTNDLAATVDSTLDDLTSGMGAAAKRKLFGDNARTIYRLGTG